MGYTTEWQLAVRPDGKPLPCRTRNCTGAVEFIEWESPCGGFEDTRYRCTACGNSWWVEGADA